MAFTVREAVIISTSELIADGHNQHIRAQVRCTDGPPDVYDVMILNTAAHRILGLRAAGTSAALVVAGHLHPYNAPDGPRVELALTHLGLGLESNFNF
ncbi:hypothetical protein ALI44B_14035 [Leifsonia sp. ALI-44-B]|uniref:hypothetical protein n=1 Tax=Leifsonia sp. ALI-44-B TaxID=1933776 RepID=UPI00097C2D20|nr:hypothetical protein [Leifsonia sp. ALI-44-B]ONI61519.1 hypothetical protein ALI44B_14035 [Leifsonia sp. ALI-44-B]